MKSALRNVFALVAVAALVAAAQAYAEHHGDHDKKEKGEKEAKVKVGEAAPDFKLMGVDGKSYSLSDMKGKTVVLEWTNPGCPFVKKHQVANTIPSIAEKFDDVMFVQINSTNEGHDDFLPADDYKKLIEDKGIVSTVLYDTDGKVGKMYGAKTTPHIFIVDKEGKIAYTGAIDDDPYPQKVAEDAKNHIERVLAAMKDGKEIEDAATRPYGCSVKYAKK